MQAQDPRSYIAAAAGVLGLTLDAARIERVAQHFERTRALAALLDAVPMTPEDEIAEIYKPAPYPEADAESPAANDGGAS